jgi:hypothetical protein
MAAALLSDAPPADTPADRITELAAHLHAATAELAQRLAAFDAARGWAGDGIRSCAHWLSINAGLEHSTACDLLRVGHALASLPGAPAGARGLRPHKQALCSTPGWLR